MGRNIPDVLVIGGKSNGKLVVYSGETTEIQTPVDPVVGNIGFNPHPSLEVTKEKYRLTELRGKDTSFYYYRIDHMSVDTSIQELFMLAAVGGKYENEK
jgi:hypothetical protein